MKVMIFAAGKGSRLLPLTERKPKPLVNICGQPIIERTILQLKAAGFYDIVINVCYKREAIMARLGDGQHYGVSIRYSIEETALETAGGLKHAGKLLGDAPYLIVNSDIVTNYPYAELRTHSLRGLAHLVLINKARHCATGDFSLTDTAHLTRPESPDYTYSGIAVISPEILTPFTDSKLKLATVLQHHIGSSKLTGELFTGYWADVGTLDRLKQVESEFAQFFPDDTPTHLEQS